MALIFDRFKTRKKAEAFAAHVRETYKRKASVYDSQEASQGPNGGFPKDNDVEVYDIFPYELTAPIVLVERFHEQIDSAIFNDPSKLRKYIDEGQPDTESFIENDVEKFGGVFAGT
jgi:hypothetical protein